MNQYSGVYLVHLQIWRGKYSKKSIEIEKKLIHKLLKMCANNDSKNKQNIDNVTCHRYEFQKKHYVVILYRNKPD